MSEPNQPTAYDADGDRTAPVLLCALLQAATDTETGTSSRHFLLAAALELTECKKAYEVEVMESSEPIAGCLDRVYDAIRANPADAAARGAAAELEAGIQRLKDLNRFARIRQRRIAQAVVEAASATGDGLNASASVPFDAPQTAEAVPPDRSSEL